ncbi:MAG: immunoglobulin domain-containing protein [Limisphaerales bacterium]
MNTTQHFLTIAAFLAAAVHTLGQPSITVQPTDQVAALGASASFRVTATGASPVSYQWRLRDADLLDATNVSLRLVNVQFSDAAPYSVVVSDGNGAVTSPVAWLSVLPTNVVNLGDLELSFGVPTNMTALNSPTDDDASSISTDGLTFYFDSMRGGGVGDLDIWVSTRSHSTAPWSAPVNVGPPINSESSDGSPRISADGLSLYFDSERPGGVGGFDIWVATRATSSADSPFAAPTRLDPPVNSPDHEVGASLSADELILVFASDRPGGAGGIGDLWITTRADRTASWDTPVDLAELNSPNTELFPCLSPDGLLLFFLSSRTSEPNGNVWVSKRATVTSPFGPPVHVESVATTLQRARPHALSYDGTTLYHSSFNRDGGEGGWDLWEISLARIPELRAPRLNASGAFEFELIGRQGAHYGIQVSTDATTWAPWITTNTAATLLLSDPSASSEARRLYRVLSH